MHVHKSDNNTDIDEFEYNSNETTDLPDLSGTYTGFLNIYSYTHNPCGCEYDTDNEKYCASNAYFIKVSPETEKQITVINKYWSFLETKHNWNIHNTYYKYNKTFTGDDVNAYMNFNIEDRVNIYIFNNIKDVSYILKWSDKEITHFFDNIYSPKCLFIGLNEFGCSVCNNIMHKYPNICICKNNCACHYRPTYESILINKDTPIRDTIRGLSLYKEIKAIHYEHLANDNSLYYLAGRTIDNTYGIFYMYDSAINFKKYDNIIDYVITIDALDNLKDLAVAESSVYNSRAS